MDDLNFDILSWYVRGLGDYQKRHKLLNWVKNIRLRMQLCLCKKHIRLSKQGNNGNNCGEDQ